MYVHGGNGHGNGRIKLIDFGTATRFKPGVSLSDLYGTQNTEMIKGSYTEASDVWSCGVILYTMIMNKVPFDGFSEKEIFNNILNKPVMLRAALEKGKSTQCIDLLKRSLYKNP